MYVPETKEKMEYVLLIQYEYKLNLSYTQKYQCYKLNIKMNIGFRK